MTPEFWMGIAGIGGTLIATIATSAFHLRSESMKQRAQINEKILDRRIEAYIALEDIISNLTTVQYCKVDVSGGVDIPYPYFFQNLKAYSTNHIAWSKAHIKIKIWSTARLHKEMNLFDNYWTSLNNEVEKIQNLNNKSTEDLKLHELGTIVLEDFRYFRERINPLIQTFFQDEIYSIKPSPFGVENYYPGGEKLRILKETNLFTNDKIIKNIYQ